MQIKYVLEDLGLHRDKMAWVLATVLLILLFLFFLFLKWRYKRQLIKLRRNYNAEKDSSGRPGDGRIGRPSDGTGERRANAFGDGAGIRGPSSVQGDDGANVLTREQELLQVAKNELLGVDKPIVGRDQPILPRNNEEVPGRILRRRRRRKVV